MNTEHMKQLDMAIQAESPVLDEVYGAIKIGGASVWREMSSKLDSSIYFTMFAKDVEVQRIIAEDSLQAKEGEGKAQALLANPWLDTDIQAELLMGLRFDHAKSNHPLYCFAPFTVTNLLSPLHRAIAGLPPIRPDAREYYTSRMIDTMETTARKIPEYLRPRVTRLYYGLRAAREPEASPISQRFAEVGWDGRALGIAPISEVRYDNFMKLFLGRNYVMWSDKKNTEVYYKWEQRIISLYTSGLAWNVNSLDLSFPRR